MPRVLVDVNVFIDAATRDPAADRPGRRPALMGTNAYRGVIECLIGRQDWVLVTSRHILNLVRRVLAAEYRWAEKEAGAYADLIADLAGNGGTIVEDEHTFAQALGGPDHEDGLILTTAVVGEADIVVTSDTRLLALSPVKGRPMISPTEFIRRTARGDGR